MSFNDFAYNYIVRHTALYYTCSSLIVHLKSFKIGLMYLFHSANTFPVLLIKIKRLHHLLKQKKTINQTLCNSALTIIQINLMFI